MMGKRLGNARFVLPGATKASIFNYIVPNLNPKSCKLFTLRRSLNHINTGLPPHLFLFFMRFYFIGSFL